MPSNVQTHPLLTKLDDLRSQFSEYHTALRENRRFYRQDFEEDVLPSNSNDWDITTIMPPTSRRAIDEAVDHVLTRVDVVVPVRKTEDKKLEHQTTAERKRLWTKMLWANIDQYYNMPGDLRKPMFSEGRVCVRKTINWLAIPNFPGEDATAAEKREFKTRINELGEQDEFLWEFDLLDNEGVFEDPSNHRDPQYVYAEYKVLTEEARRLFPRKGDPKPGERNDSGTDDLPDHEAWRNGSDYEKVLYIEYWSKPSQHEPGQFVQWIEREEVATGDNPYPYVPIAIEDNGYGEVRKNSLIEEKYIGMTQFMHSIFIAEARQMTSWEAVTEITAFPVAVGRNMAKDRQFKLGPAAIIQLRGQKGEIGSEDLEFLKWPEIPLGVIQLAEKTSQLANSALKMDTIGGVPLPGVDTATEADQQIRNATSKLSSPVAALERICAKLTRWCLMDVEQVIEAPVTLFGNLQGEDGEARLEPQDLDGFYLVRVALTTSDEDALNMVKARFWSEMYNILPLLSGTTVMERGRISDTPVAEMLKRDSENIFYSPEMVAGRTLAAARAVGQFQTAVSELVRQSGQKSADGGGLDPVLAQNQPPGDGTPSEQLIQSALTQRDVTQGPAAVRGPTGGS